MAAWQERTELLLGSDNMQRLARANVLVIGLGGVGAYAAEMLVRAGVGSLTIADADSVGESNINRQLVALHSTVGRKKTEVLAQRLLDINPQLSLTIITEYLRDERTFEVLDSQPFDFVVDAIDTLAPKIHLIVGAMKRGLRLVSSMGAGGKLDPTKVETADIAHTHHDALAHALRKRLHSEGVRTGFTAVFSPEPSREGAMITCEETNKRSQVGTISYMPAAFGLACASVVVRALIADSPQNPENSPQNTK
mgnify:FL=1